MVGLTSQPKEIADKIAAEWKVPIVHLSDTETQPHNTARNHKVVLTDRPDYPEKLMAQPGVVVVDREGKELYSWRLVPKPENIMGAVDRVDAKAVWSALKPKVSKSPMEPLSAQEANAIPWDRQAGTLANNLGAALKSGKAPKFLQKMAAASGRFTEDFSVVEQPTKVPPEQNQDAKL